MDVSRLPRRPALDVFDCIDAWALGHADSIRVAEVGDATE